MLSETRAKYIKLLECSLSGGGATHQRRIWGLIRVLPQNYESVILVRLSISFPIVHCN